MKKTTRLTALLLALVLLLGTLSASATETEGTVISLDNWTLDQYTALLAEAETLGLTAGTPCGSSNPYCASVTKLADMETALERYEYLASLSSTAIIGVLMHYRDYQNDHTAEDILCLCSPNLDAVYTPGDIEKHDADCPWHFANMTVNEQYHILMKLDADAQLEYKATLSEEQQTELEKFTREIQYYSPCDPDTCPIAAKHGKDFFAMDTFYLYEYLEGLKEEDGDPSGDALEIIQHLRNNHMLDDVFCQCEQFTFVNSSHKFGRSHHTGCTIGDLYIDCPWRFDQLTTAEQAQVLAELENEDADTDYAYALLSDKQKAELDAFLAGVGETDKTITTNKDSGEGSTEPEVQVNISVPAGVFGADVKHVMVAGEALMTTEKTEALNAVSTGYTLAAFDISFYNLDRPGEKLQPEPGKTVPLTFTVDVSNVDGDTMQVYHLVENEDGSITAEAVGEPIVVDKSSGTQNVTVEAESFSTWLIEGLCSGDTENCSFNEFADKSGFERAELLKELVGEQAALSTDDYNEFYNHLRQYHSDTKAVCFCFGNAYDIVQYGYGTTKHTEGADLKDNPCMCPWHFSQVSVADEYTVYQDMSEADKAAALQSIEGTEKYDQLMALINPPEIVEPEIKADTTSVELSFSADATGHQWYQSTDGGITWTAVVGAESATLTLDLSQSADALGYIYKCTATIDGEQVESQLMGLTNAQFRGWLLDGADAITVTMAMLNRALEVQAVLDARDADYGALKALRLEGTELYSVYTGEVIADFNPDTRALVDRSMGLTVGYVDFTNGTIVAPPVDETTGGDETAN